MTLPPGWAPPQVVEQPGVIPLRPLGVGDVFSGTFATIRGHWAPLLAVACAVAAVSLLFWLPAMLVAEPLVRAYLALVQLDPGASTAQTQAVLDDFFRTFGDVAPWFAVALLAQAFAHTILDAASAVVVGQAALGKSISSGETLSRVARMLPRLLLLALLSTIAIAFGTLLCIIPGLVLALIWIAAPSVVALEDTSAIQSMRRSAQLVGRSFWRTTGIVILISIVYGFAVQLLAMPVSLLTQAGSFDVGSASTSETGMTLILLGYLVLALIGLLTFPFVAIGRTLVYLDLRMHHEQLSPTLIAASRAKH